MSFFSELKRRKVVQVAGVYLVVAWLVIQVIDVINEPLQLPPWFATVVLVLLAAGFPFALIFAWVFDITPQGVTRTPSEGGAVADSGKLPEYMLLGVIAVGITWLVVRDSFFSETGVSTGTPVVFLMDTPAPRGVYDPEIREVSGTNADVLSDVLRDLPVVLQKESIGALWDRETQILAQDPDLVLIHRSAFFHSMNHEMGFGYGDDPENFDEERWQRLYAIADDKLAALIGYIGTSDPSTRFLVYTRGSGGRMEDGRNPWIAGIEGRFPALQGRVSTMMVPGGLETGSFKNADAIEAVRQHVIDILGLDVPDAAPTLP